MFPGLRGWAFTRKTPPSIIKNHTMSSIANTSPSIIPQITATIGMMYVTDEANKGLFTLMRLLNAIIANPVPTTERMLT